MLYLNLNEEKEKGLLIKFALYKFASPVKSKEDLAKAIRGLKLNDTEWFYTEVDSDDGGNELKGTYIKIVDKVETLYDEKRKRYVDTKLAYKKHCYFILLDDILYLYGDHLIFRDCIFYFSIAAELSCSAISFEPAQLYQFYDRLTSVLKIKLDAPKLDGVQLDRAELKTFSGDVFTLEELKDFGNIVGVEGKIEFERQLFKTSLTKSGRFSLKCPYCDDTLFFTMHQILKECLEQ